MWVGIYQLIAQSAIWKVRSLWDIENLLSRGLVDSATGCGPQLTQDTEKTTLSTAVRSWDHQVHTRFDREAHFCDETVAIGWKNGDVNKLNPVWFDDLTLTFAAHIFHIVFWLAHCYRFVSFLLHHDSLVAILAQVFQHFLHLVDEGSIASQRLNFFVRND